MVAALLACAAVPAASVAQETSPDAREKQYIDGGFTARAVSARDEKVTVYNEEGISTGELSSERLFGAGGQGLEILAIRDGFVFVIHAGKAVWLSVDQIVLSGDVGSYICGGFSLGQSVFARKGYEPQENEAIQCMNSPVPRASIDVPFLPWPPPRPTYIVDATKSLGKARYLKDVSVALSSRLEGKGYDNLRYFSVPGGFAITTLVERFGADGKPAQPRWIRSKLLRGASFSDYFRALISGEEGRFRMFALVVTNADMDVSHLYANQTDVARWEALGRPALSRELGSQGVPKGTKLWLMVYEFHPSADSKTRLVPTASSSVPSATHRAAIGF